MLFISGPVSIEESMGYKILIYSSLLLWTRNVAN